MNELETNHWIVDAQTMGISVIGQLFLMTKTEAFSQGGTSLYLTEGSQEPSSNELLEITAAAARLQCAGKAPHVLKKIDENLWTFRRLSWDQGPFWYPRPAALHEILSLI